ncbi:MAG: DNRLRE domain-containing protein, partial [Anaerolineae bacterium]|nr:DNRLRE domain-containing protein [Anaerolineae bacterium]
DTVLVISTGVRGDLTPLACNDDVEGGSYSQVDLPVTAGATYHIVVSGWWLDTGTLILSASDLAVPPGTQTFAPVADAQVKQSSPTRNYGVINNLRATYSTSSQIDSYLKFDLSGLSGTVTRATLRLFFYDGGPSGGSVSLAENTYRGSGTAWTETGVTWNNRPALLSALATAGAVTNNTWAEYDVTAAITGNGTYTFALTGVSSNSLLAYSKEAADRHPELVIEFGGDPVLPVNDEIGGAFTIGSLPYSNTQSTGAATSADDDPQASCDDSGGNVWYRFTAPANMIVRFETTGSDYHTWLAVFAGPPGALTEVGCSDAITSVVHVPVSASTTYYLLIGGDDGEAGSLTLSASELQDVCAAVTEIPEIECRALVALYNSTGGNNWYDSTGWLADNTPCDWYGVECLGSGVDGLRLNNNNLIGTIPPEIGDLDHLFGLNLADNQLMSAIPSEIGDLATLEDLWLQNNQFSGPIPPEIAGLRYVNYLDLSNNFLEGQIPPEMGTMHPWEMNLSGNLLEGPIPPELGANNAAERLSLANNRFSGEVPPALAALPLGSDRLDIGYNMLSASDPAVAAWLGTVDPNWAGTQTVPPTGVSAGGVSTSAIAVSWTPIAYTADGGAYEVGVSLSPGGPYTVRCTTLSKADGGCTVEGLAENTTYYFAVRSFTPLHGAQKNYLTSEWSAGVSAKTLGGAFSCASVTEIPEASCLALVALYHSTGGDHWTDNTGWLQDNTPCDWYGVSCAGIGFEGIRLSNNNLVGTIPPEVGDLLWLEDLYLDHNALTGPIPPEIANLQYLNILDLSHNHLSGPLPPVLGTMHTWEMELSGNLLEGPIPAELGNVTALEQLGLAINRLSGEVPAALLNLALGDGDLDIGYNMLSASDPAVTAWLNTHDPDWASTQTVAPTNGSASGLSTSAIQVSWTPIAYTGDGGYYEISYSLAPGGPYTAGCVTANKTETGCTIGGLAANTTYYIVLRTFTPLHGSQQNDLLSAWSAEVSAKTLADGTPTTLTFTPVADAQVKQAYPTKNYGTLNNLRALYSTTGQIDSYLKFEVAGVTGSVTSATIRFYFYDGGPDGGSMWLAANTYRGTGAPWTETGVTWNNRPELIHLHEIAGAIANNTWREYEVNGAITGNGTYTFALIGNSSNSL